MPAPKTLNLTEKQLGQILYDLQWIAQRYADGRDTCVASILNAHTRTLLSAGYDLYGKGGLFAESPEGRDIDGLRPTEEVFYRSSKTLRHNPGSPQAQDLGCLCPVTDNHYGHGLPHPEDGPRFYVRGNCPLHGTSAQHGGTKEEE